MEWLTILYFFYSFVSLYFLFLFLLIFIGNRREFFSFPEVTKNYSLSIVVPCYNEENDIGGTIQALLDSDYKNLKKIIVVDDCSTDGSFEIIKSFAEKYPRVMAVQTPKNTGRASGAKNYGAKFVRTELLGFTDADSFPQKNAIRKMIGFFDDKIVGGVTSLVLVKKRKKLIEILQSIEYKIIAFSRKLLGFVDAIYVTPGPLALYRRSAFKEVGGFDENNLTEDIEIVWHLVSKGYKIEMAVPARVYTTAPDTVKGWFKQRIRWNIGGIQTVNKYKTYFFKAGMLGTFILPFFIFSWFLGVTGLFFLAYRTITGIVVRYFATTYSIQAQTAIMTFRELNLTPSILVFFGLATFILSLSFTLIALLHSKEREFKNHGLFHVLGYMLFYLMMYPFLLIVSLYKFLRGKTTW